MSCSQCTPKVFCISGLVKTAIWATTDDIEDIDMCVHGCHTVQIKSERKRTMVTLCRNAEMNMSNYDPEVYFLPITAGTYQNHGKYLIYHCEHVCGGLWDRFRGIVNSFILALITNRTFVIHHTMPCPLQNFLRTQL